MDFDAVILAGGRSSRMGRDKAWLPLDGRPLLASQLERVSSLDPGELIISGRPGVDYSAFPYRVVLDAEPDRGPLGGITTAFAATSAPQLLVLAVDLPHMTADWLRQLLGRSTSACGVVPRVEGEWQPLAALYPRACRGIVREALRGSARVIGDFVLSAFAAGLVIPWDVPHPDRSCLHNWNRPEDLLASTGTQVGKFHPP